MIVLLRAFAMLPFWVMYRLSDVTFVLLYYLVRYRRTVVRKNLRDSFPEKDERELRRIERQFYRNFADYIFETVKLLHISDRAIMRRMTFSGVELPDGIMAGGRSVAAYFSHCGNWEWAPSVILHSRHRHDVDAAFCQVYRPLRNKRFDRLMLTVRSRFGARSFPKATVFRDLFKLTRSGMPSITGFMSDQKPSHGDPTYVTTFLNHPTAMISGTESLARRLGMAAIYWDMEKPRRGHYHITMRLIAEDVSAAEPGAVTEAYTRLLEQTIRRNPSIWLWTHKRWKKPVRLDGNGAQA